MTVGAMKQISLSIIEAKAGTTYTIGSDISASATESLGASVEQTFFANLGSGSGTITVSRLPDTEAEGTFSFTARSLSGGSVAVTEGKFLVKLTKI